MALMPVWSGSLTGWRSAMPGAMVTTGLLPLAAWSGWRSGGEFVADWVGLGFAGATVLLLLLALFRSGPLEEAPRSAGVAALAWLYCGVLPASAVAIRQRFGWEWVILAFVVTWANDILAYFSGRFLGRHKLMERISPKKTWEGFAGGAVGSILGALAVKWLFLPGATVPGCLAVGAGAAVLGPLGDLAESMLKRAAGVKDSGRIMPGHGGLLDRIDALLFVLPWVYATAALRRGKFSFEPRTGEVPPSIATPTVHLLIEAVRRRVVPPPKLMIGDVNVDLELRLAKRSNARIELTAMEWAVLARPARPPGPRARGRTTSGRRWSSRRSPGTSMRT